MTKFINPEEIVSCEGYMLVGFNNKDLFEEMAEIFSPFADMAIKKIKTRVFPEKISLS